MISIVRLVRGSTLSAFVLLGRSMFQCSFALSAPNLPPQPVVPVQTAPAEAKGADAPTTRSSGAAARKGSTPKAEKKKGGNGKKR